MNIGFIKEDEGEMEEETKDEKTDVDKISDIVPNEIKKEIKKLAKEHIGWLFKTIEPLLLTEFEHGARHGYELALNKVEDETYNILTENSIKKNKKK